MTAMTVFKLFFEVPVVFYGLAVVAAGWFRLGVNVAGRRGGAARGGCSCLFPERARACVLLPRPPGFRPWRRWHYLFCRSGATQRRALFVFFPSRACKPKPSGSGCAIRRGLRPAGVWRTEGRGSVAVAPPSNPRKMRGFLDPGASEAGGSHLLLSSNGRLKQPRLRERSRR